jgi:hypothetical protein
MIWKEEYNFELLGSQPPQSLEFSYQMNPAFNSILAKRYLSYLKRGKEIGREFFQK